MYNLIKSTKKLNNVSRGTLKKIEKKTKIIYIIYDTTFMFEPGQNRKIAALKISKCVCLFLWMVKL